MNKNTQKLIAQVQTPTPTIQYHDIIINSIRQIIIPELIILLVTSFAAFASNQVLRQIKRLQKDIENDLINNKKQRKLSVSEFNQVKEIFYQTILFTGFNRISLFLLKNYSIVDNNLVATSFSVAAQVTNGLIELGVFDEKIDYIVQGIDDLLDSQVKYKYFSHRDKGYICTAWLRQRHTISYGLFLLEEAKGIILLENREKLFNLKLFSRFNINNNNNNNNLLNNLNKIDKILS